MDDKVAQALARFLVIRTCGYVEQVVEECSKAYLAGNSYDNRCISFTSSWFGRGRNPTPATLIELVKRFDPNWAGELEDLLTNEDELLAREMEFLVDRRNRIAHGLNEGVNQGKALSLVHHANSVAEWFISTFDPRS